MPNLLSRRVAFVDIEAPELATAGDSEGGASVEAQEAANQQLYELAIRQHATSPAEAAQSYEQLLAQPIVVATIHNGTDCTGRFDLAPERRACSEFDSGSRTRCHAYYVGRTPCDSFALRDQIAHRTK